VSDPKLDFNGPAVPPAKIRILAPSEAEREIKGARAILLTVGCLTILANLIFLVKYHADIDVLLGKEFDKEIAKREQEAGSNLVAPGEKSNAIADARPAALRYLNIFYGAGMALGVVFMVLGLCIRLAPVPITVTGLGLFVGAQATYIYLDPMPLTRVTIIVKVAALIAMLLAVLAALAYRRSVEQTPPAAGSDV
jgi:hypothetical protein